jgi:hypothetical protein
MIELDNGIKLQDENIHTFFPELRHVELQRYAKRWAGKYVNAVQRICLNNYVPKRLAAYKEIWPGFAVRYALIFELLSDADRKTLKELETATEQHETVHRGYPALFDNRFFTVYANKPEDDYSKHWVIFLKKEGQASPPGVLTDEPYWVLYNSQSSSEAHDDGLRLGTRSKAPSTNLSAELFPKLNPIEFTERAQEWIEKWPLINDVRLYLGRGMEKQCILIFITQDKKALADSDFWTDSLIPLQPVLLSIYKDPKDFNISQWQLFTLGLEEDLPVELVRPDHCWGLFRATDDGAQIQGRKVQSPDENVLWITYSDATREVWLNDCYGHNRVLSKPYFNSMNENVFGWLQKNIQKRITRGDLSEHGIDLKNKTLHKVVDELGFKGRLKKLFFDVSKTDILFRNSVTRKELIEANVPDSKEELYQLFFK